MVIESASHVLQLNPNRHFHLVVDRRGGVCRHTICRVRKSPLICSGTGNLALNRAAYASSSADFVNTGHMATDGETVTKWQSKAGGPQWIYVDLGSRLHDRQGRPEMGGGVCQDLQDPGVDRCRSIAGHGAGRTLDGCLRRHGRQGRRRGDSAVSRQGAVREAVVRRNGDAPRRIAGGIRGPRDGAGRPRSPTSPRRRRDGTWDLCAGWKLRSQSFVADDAGKISASGYDDRQWLAATVPGTVLTSYQNLGAVPDMFYGDHQLGKSPIGSAAVSWWYRTEVHCRRAIAESGCG